MIAFIGSVDNLAVGGDVGKIEQCALHGIVIDVGIGDSGIGDVRTHHVCSAHDAFRTALDLGCDIDGSDRFLRDKAIDIVDEASAICKVSYDHKDGGKIKKMKRIMR